MTSITNNTVNSKNTKTPTTSSPSSSTPRSKSVISSDTLLLVPSQAIRASAKTTMSKRGRTYAMSDEEMKNMIVIATLEETINKQPPSLLFQDDDSVVLDVALNNNNNNSKHHEEAAEEESASAQQQEDDFAVFWQKYMERQNKAPKRQQEKGKSKLYYHLLPGNVRNAPPVHSSNLWLKLK